MTARKGIGAQRAHVVQEGGPILAARYLDPAIFQRGDIVLVIPEADVSGCRHDDVVLGEAGTECWCQDCGGYRDLRYERSRWQRPRILRVRKEAKR